jgi:hypothetical protein
MGANRSSGSPLEQPLARRLPGSAATNTDLRAWRRARLQRAGVPEGIAAALGDDLRLDLHALIGLLERGCPPRLAARIVAPLDQEKSR